MIISEAVRRARWVEAKVAQLKSMGLSFDAIAEQITRVGRGQAQLITSIPDGLVEGSSVAGVLKLRWSSSRLLLADSVVGR